MKKHVQRFFSILAIILFFVITYYMGRPLVAFVSEPGAFQAWVDAQGFVGVLLFLGMLVLQVFAAIIPGGPFEIAAGYAFGIVKGSLICAIGTTLGSMVVFFLVRRFGHKFLHLFVEDTELEKLTFLICFVGRLPAIILSVLSGHALSNAQYHIAVISFAIIVIAAGLGAYFVSKHKNKE